MGEAKRRQATTPQYRDMRTGELRPAKDGGDLETFLSRWERGERPPVPCNGCTACCYHPHVDVYPKRERAEDLLHMQLEQDADGQWWMRKRDDGACIHLGTSGCAIYEHRPQACRKYDCRIYSLFGVTDKMDGDRWTPMWAFRRDTMRNRILLAAYQMAGMLTLAERNRDNQSLAADEVAAAALPKVPGLTQAMETISRVPQEKWRETFGFEPALTADAVLQTQRKAIKALGLEDLLAKATPTV